MKVICCFLGLATLFNWNYLQAQTPSTNVSGTNMITIGDAHNEADELRHGACNKPFRLGAYKWTVADWYDLLTHVASQIDPVAKIADPHGLWNKGMERWIRREGSETTGYTFSIISGAEKLPITYVNLYDFCRACNYTQNKDKLPLAIGKSFDSITEEGAYKITITSTDDNGRIIQEAQKTANARYYIPTQDEWIKGAYYKGGTLNAGYWLYPTQHDSPNPADRESHDPAFLENQANYNLYPLWPWAPSLEICDVDYCGRFDSQGRAVGTRSFYGCFDMAGNVNEWTTTSVEIDENGRVEADSEEITMPKYISGRYIVRGGDYTTEYHLGVGNYLMRTCEPWTLNPNTRSDRVGFRMAEVETAADAVTASSGYTEEAYHANWKKDPIDYWNHLSTSDQAATIVDLATLLSGGDALLAGWKGMRGGAELASGIIPNLAVAGKNLYSGARWLLGLDKEKLRLEFAKMVTTARQDGALDIFLSLDNTSKLTKKEIEQKIGKSLADLEPRLREHEEFVGSELRTIEESIAKLEQERSGLEKKREETQEAYNQIRLTQDQIEAIEKHPSSDSGKARDLYVDPKKTSTWFTAVKKKHTDK